MTASSRATSRVGLRSAAGAEWGRHASAVARRGWQDAASTGKGWRDIASNGSTERRGQPPACRIVSLILGMPVLLAFALLLPGKTGCGHPPGNPPVDARPDAMASCPPYDAVIDSPVPVRIEGLEDVVDMAAGYEHHCAVTGNGDVYCWGSNCLGALGDGTTTDSATPVLVAGLPPAESVVVPRGGWRASCALTLDQEVWCWGQG